MIEKAIKSIIKHEGSGPVKSGRYFPYACPAQKMTIGFGRNIEENGISEDEAFFLLRNDVQDSIKMLRKIFSKFDTFLQKRQIALIDMIYNLGATKFLRFEKMISAIHKEDWLEASEQAKNSKWYSQVGERGHTIVSALK